MHLAIPKANTYAAIYRHATPQLPRSWAIAVIQYWEILVRLMCTHVSCYPLSNTEHIVAFMVLAGNMSV